MRLESRDVLCCLTFGLPMREKLSVTMGPCYAAKKERRKKRRNSVSRLFATPPSRPYPSSSIPLISSRVGDQQTCIHKKKRKEKKRKEHLDGRFRCPEIGRNCRRTDGKISGHLLFIGGPVCVFIYKNRKRAEKKGGKCGYTI